jgi:hypothetical protein
MDDLSEDSEEPKEPISFVDWFYRYCNHGEDMVFARKVWDAAQEATKEDDKELKDLLVRACVAARAYLEERGLRTKGVVGRTVVLPLLDEAIGRSGSSIEAGTVIV